MPNIVIYPRGYVSITKSDFMVGTSMESEELSRSDFDDIFMVQYTNFINQLVNINDWNFQGEVIKTAMRLFGNFGVWVSAQTCSNHFVNGVNLAFIKDTIQFIREGHRDMSVISWRDLVVDYPDPVPGSASKKRLLNNFGNIADLLDNPIGKWCSYPEGFGDMIVSMYIFFGSGRSALKRPIEKSYGHFLSSQSS